jgi:RNA polymerase sigma-70 factor (ECF subfamily)
MAWVMMEVAMDPPRNQPTGLCEDAAGEALALIKRMARGDAAALAALHGMWAPVLLGCACRMLGDRREADEVLRVTFERMWKRAEGYDPHQSPPFVWAFVMMRGLALERLRRRAGKRDAAHSSHERGEPVKVLTADDSRRLRTAIDQLDLEDRSCLEHAVFLAYAGPEAAPATVKNHLRRALETLRNQLSCHEL